MTVLETLPTVVFQNLSGVSVGKNLRGHWFVKGFCATARDLHPQHGQNIKLPRVYSSDEKAPSEVACLFTAIFNHPLHAPTSVLGTEIESCGTGRSVREDGHTVQGDQNGDQPINNKDPPPSCDPVLSIEPRKYCALQVS